MQTAKKDTPKQTRMSRRQDKKLKKKKRFNPNEIFNYGKITYVFLLILDKVKEFF